MLKSCFNLKVFILPRVAELFINKEKQRGCPLPDLEKEGVYSLKCGDCEEAIYVGKTERNLKIRMPEHLRDFKNKKSENSL